MIKKYKKSPKGINVISHRFQPMEIDKCGKLNPNGVERFLLRYYFKNANYGRAEYNACYVQVATSVSKVGVSPAVVNKKGSIAGETPTLPASTIKNSIHA